MSSDSTDKIEQARQFIQFKHYDRARMILAGVDDPKARELLKALDRIAPQKRANASSGWMLIGIGVAAVMLLVVVVVFVNSQSEPEAAPQIVSPPTVATETAIPSHTPSPSPETAEVAAQSTAISLTDDRPTLPPTWTALPSATITNTPTILRERTVAVQTISVVYTANAIATYDAQSTEIAENSTAAVRARSLPTHAVVEGAAPPPSEPQVAVVPIPALPPMTCSDSVNTWTVSTEYAGLNIYLEAVTDAFKTLEYKQSGGLLWAEPIAESILEMQVVRDAVAAYSFHSCMADYRTLLTGSMDKLMHAINNYAYDLIPVETFNIETQTSVQMWNQAEALLNQLRTGG